MQHGIGVFGHLLMVERGMRAAEQDGDATGSELVGHFVGTQRRHHAHRNGDDVDLRIVIRLIDLVVEQLDVPAGRGQGGEVGHHGADELAFADAERAPVVA